MEKTSYSTQVPATKSEFLPSKKNGENGLLEGNWTIWRMAEPLHLVVTGGWLLVGFDVV
jgi:hypothetical protein